MNSWFKYIYLSLIAKTSSCNLYQSLLDTLPGSNIRRNIAVNLIRARTHDAWVDR
jgi:hypothetical protein